ncbi:MAG: lipopolysaccharide biosynthesis protein [Ferruginibacter sp.]|nr:lipopolysaccharide biosynthesis protein [Ferruginibacter sp.]
MDLVYFFKVLFRRKWIIIGLSALAVIAAFVFLMFKKPLFVSQAQYSTGFTAEKVRLIDGTSAIDLFTADVKFNNAIETFKSPKVVSIMAYKLMLHDMDNPAKAYRPLSKKQMESGIYKLVPKETAKRVLIDKINKNELLRSDVEGEINIIEYVKLYRYDYESILEFMTIERVGRTDYLDIIFRSENPLLSSLVVNNMGQEFLNYYKNLTSQRTEENAEGIKKMVTAQQSKVDSLGENLFKAKQSQGSIDPVSLSTSAMETVKELETKLAEEKSKENEHANRKQYLEERLKTLTGGAATTTAAPSNNKEEILRLTNKRNDLQAELARKGGSDADLEKQIADLRGQINAKISSGGSSRPKSNAKDIDDLTSKIAEENAMLNAARSTIEDYNSRIRKYTGLSNKASAGSDVKIDAIKSQLDIENKQLGSVIEKYTQAEGLVKDDPTTNFIQTRIGQPAIDPESKKTMLTMLLSGMSMLFLSSVIFLFLEIFDPTLKTPTIFRKHLKMKLAAVLNHLPLKKQNVTDIVINENDGKKFKKENIFKNNIRKLRHQVTNSGQQVFLITSTQKATGKTTVVEALAASLLLSKKKVLLIDLNFGHNSLTAKYSPEVMIQDIAENADIDSAFTAGKLWTPTSTEGLALIGCKEGSFTPSEALYNLDMTALLEKVKASFDYIFIEAAALNDFADSKEISRYAEGVFPVFSAASSISHADDESLKFLTELGAKNQGAVLNDVLTENINF